MNELEKKSFCESIIARAPKSLDAAKAYNNLAVWYEKQSNDDEALKCYAASVNIWPEYVTAHYNLGLFFLRRHQWNEAIRQFRNVILLEPTRRSAQEHLGTLYLKQEQWELAQALYADVLTREPENSDAWNNLGVIALRTDKKQEAIDLFAKALAFDNNHQEARNNLAATFMHFDRFENAARHYYDLIKDYPNNLEYHYNLAVAYMQLGNLSDAVLYFKRVLFEKTLNNFTIASMNNLSMIHWRLGEKKQAKKLLEQVLEKEPNHAISCYLLQTFSQVLSKESQEISEKKAFEKAPMDYVTHLFDNYALQYDAHLKALKYALPEQMQVFLTTYVSPETELDCDTSLRHSRTPLRHSRTPLRHSREGGNPAPFFNHTLDLGCGTGLSGVILKPFSTHLTGVDCSAKMLEQARDKNLYDDLECLDIDEFLDSRLRGNDVKGRENDIKGRNNTEKAEYAVESGQFNCICALEVLEYYGDLNNLFQDIHKNLTSDGLFIFSIECGRDNNFTLQETARFAHSPKYIHQLIQENNWTLLTEQFLEGRIQNNASLPSVFYAVRK